MQCKEESPSNPVVVQTDLFKVELKDAVNLAHSYLKVNNSARIASKSARSSASADTIKEVGSTKTIQDKEGNPLMYVVSFGGKNMRSNILHRKI